MKKAIALLSGGIDSPVAAALMMKKGYQVVLVHFFNLTPGSQAVEDKVNRIAQHIARFQNGKTKLYMVPFRDAQMDIIKTVPGAYRMIVYRRLMFRIAEEIARKEGAEAFITGDNLGQVASQTLKNLAVIHSAAALPILTPLLGNDKQETVDLAQELGTFELSTLPYNDCCSYLVAKHPATGAKKEVVEHMEEQLPFKEIISKAVEKVNVKTFTATQENAAQLAPQQT